MKDIRTKLFKVQSKLLDIGEKTNLFLHSIGAYILPKEMFKKYYQLKRSELNIKYLK